MCHSLSNLTIWRYFCIFSRYIWLVELYTNWHLTSNLGRWDGATSGLMNTLVKGSGWFIRGWGLGPENMTQGSLCCWLLIDISLPCGMLLFLTVAPAEGVLGDVSGATRHAGRGRGCEEQLSALTRPEPSRAARRRRSSTPEHHSGSSRPQDT